jgi:hypothetical protein
MATQQWRRRHAVATLIAACAAAAVVAVAAAAPDVPTRNSTASASAGGAPARPGGNDDGKAYHHVWPVITRAQPRPGRSNTHSRIYIYILWLLIQLPYRSVSRTEQFGYIYNKSMWCVQCFFFLANGIWMASGGGVADRLLRRGVRQRRRRRRRRHLRAHAGTHRRLRSQVIHCHIQVCVNVLYCIVSSYIYTHACASLALQVCPCCLLIF